VVEIGDCLSQVGSGALPLDTLASTALLIRAHSSQRGLEHLAASLRRLTRPIVGRVADGALCLDLRCLDEADETVLLATLAELSANGRSAHVP
jgi:L-seryl-tRNA(Ser) seleniumtransferase